MKFTKSILLIAVGMLLGAGGIYVWQHGASGVFQAFEQSKTSESAGRVQDTKTKTTTPSPSAPTGKASTPASAREDASTGYPIDEVKPGVHVISPNGGESLCMSKTTPIRWEANGVETVTINLKDADFTYTIGSFVAASKTISWKVGDILDIGVLPAGKSYQIEIKSKDAGTNYSDASDKVFRKPAFLNSVSLRQ